jgi:hypothetical protein
MEMQFIDWLQDKEQFLNDEIENNRPGFTHLDVQLLGEVMGALRLYSQWLESEGIATWRNSDSETLDQTSNAIGRSEQEPGMRMGSRRSLLRRANDLTHATRGADLHH